MKIQKKYYTFAFFFVLFIVCIFLLVMRPTKSPKTNLMIDPETKKHWFRLKIQRLPYTQSSVRKEAKVILLWTSFFGKDNYIPTLESLSCRFKDCLVTSNRSYLFHSDAILFHLRDMKLDDMPSVRHSWQRWILLHHESPSHTPDILRFLGGKFNWTATYRLDSDINLSPFVKKRKATVTHAPVETKSKSRMAAWFVSNCHSSSNREGFVNELQKIISIDIYGGCGTNECLPKMSDECYKKISADYHYYLAFENSICKDYVTEKFFQALNTDMIPVVFGGANYSNFSPSSSFIDALSFDSPSKLAHFLLELTKDEERYKSYFNWKDEYMVYYKHYSCKICQMLHENKMTTSIGNLHEWWFSQGKCRTWMADDIITT